MNDNPASALNNENAAPTPGPAPDDNVVERIVQILKTCYDPEIPVDIYELGLIYDIDYNPDTAFADVTMTLTSPACPVAGTLPGEVEDKVRCVAGVSGARVEVVWEPSWTPDMMSEAARLELGF
ncbi:MAG: DUF59 domain-containing protein [bacterium]|nr:DUF59 domain-containing protein [bacterium]